MLKICYKYKGLKMVEIRKWYSNKCSFSRMEQIFNHTAPHVISRSLTALWQAQCQGESVKACFCHTLRLQLQTEVSVSRSEILNLGFFLLPYPAEVESKEEKKNLFTNANRFSFVWVTAKCLTLWPSQSSYIKWCRARSTSSHSKIRNLCVQDAREETTLEILFYWVMWNDMVMYEGENFQLLPPHAISLIIFYFFASAVRVFTDLQFWVKDPTSTMKWRLLLLL